MRHVRFIVRIVMDDHIVSHSVVGAVGVIRGVVVIRGVIVCLLHWQDWKVVSLTTSGIRHEAVFRDEFGEFRTATVDRTVVIIETKPVFHRLQFTLT